MAPELPPVSIVVLTYNGRKFMRDLMESLADQTYPRHLVEIIIVDNGSQDDTVAFIRKYFPEIICVALSENKGFSAGNNIGYHYASHELIVFLNQDTICHRNWLNGLVHPMLDDRRLAACVSNIIPIDPKKSMQIDRSSPIGKLFYCDLSPFGYGRYQVLRGKAFVRILLITGCSFIIRRETVNELGYLFDQRFWMYAEDTDLSLRILKSGKTVSAVRNSVVFHLHGSDFSLEERGFKKAYGAIHNRVLVFLKNMRLLEFLLFFPFLVVGGGGKVLELRMSNAQKALFFFPFGLFSFAAMMVALCSNLVPAIREKYRTGNKENNAASIFLALLKRSRLN